MASLHISLSDEMRSFVDEQVRGGRYHNHSEYVRDLIRHDQERRTRDRIEALLLEGLESGPAQPLTADDWQAIRDEARERLVRKQGS
jgi:antitoxin ParD1/3/4